MPRCIRVRARPGNLEKSWNFVVTNSRPGKSWKMDKISKCPGNVLEFKKTRHSDEHDRPSIRVHTHPGKSLNLISPKSRPGKAWKTEENDNCPEKVLKFCNTKVLQV